MYRVEQIDDIQLPLVNKFYKRCRYSAKAGRGEWVYVVKGPDSQGVTGIVAAVRLQQKAEGWAFLRSMCVDPELRGRGDGGIGQMLLKGLSDFLEQHQTYCYPFDHLQHFYAQVGFQRVDAERLPAYIGDAFLRYQQQGRKIIVMTYNAAL